MKRYLIVPAAVGSMVLATSCVSTTAGHPIGAGTHVVRCPTSAAPQQAPEVTNTGTAPRRQLQLSATKSTRQASTFTITMQLQLDGNQIEVPTTEMPVTLAVTSTCPQGFLYRATYQKPRVDPNDPNADTYQQQFDKMAGMMLTVAVDHYGNTVDSAMTNVPSYDLGGTNPLNSISDFNQATVGLPTKPIGVGAQWTARRTLSVGPAQLTVTADYQLLSIRGDIITVSSKVTETGKPYSLTIQGHKATVESLTANGQGTLQMDLSKPLGTGDIELQTITRVSVDDGSSSTTTLHTSMKIG